MGWIGSDEGVNTPEIWHIRLIPIFPLRPHVSRIRNEISADYNVHRKSVEITLISDLMAMLTQWNTFVAGVTS